MNSISDLLKQSGFRFNKGYGQNFLTDVNLLRAIASDAGITAEDTVLEVGSGAGTLTRELAAKAKRVISYEIDKNLEPVLAKTTSGLDNLEIVFKDILKEEPNIIKEKTAGSFKVAANLPYYISTPLMFYFLENDFPLVSLTVMLQREVAERITAKHGSPGYGVLTAAVYLYGDAEITRIVGRQMFTPSPEVDSAVVRVTIKDKGIKDKPAALRFIRCAFASRRKTLVNNIMMAYGLPRFRAEKLLCDNGVDGLARGESLSPEMLVRLSEDLSKN